MKKDTTPFAGSRFVAIKIVLVYVIFTCLWISFSDSLLKFILPNQISVVSALKSYIYVIFSAFLLFFLFHQATRKIRKSQQRYHGLFKEAAITIIEGDFSKVKDFINKRAKEGISNWQEYFDQNPQAVIQCAALVKIVDINNEGLRFLGLNSNKKNVPCNLDCFLIPDSLKTFKETIIMLAKGSCRLKGEIPARFYKGDILQLFFQLSVAPGFEKNLSKVLISIIDITKRKEFEVALNAKEQHLRQIIDLVPHFIFAKDQEGRFILVNRTVAEAYGTTVADLIGKTDADFNKSPEEVKHFREDDLEVIRSGKPKYISQESITDAHGQVRLLSTTKIPFWAHGIDKPCILGVAEDITERKYLENKLITLAHYDSLTNFPNRALFFERARLGISHARRSQTACAVLFIDLDHFKDVNDTLGHTLGDELIKDTAGKLADCVREVDTIARFGGDEFIVFLNGLEDPNQARHIAERIRERFNCPRQVWGNDLFVTASVGIATYPQDGNNLEDLLKNADIAMYAAKGAGRNMYCFFNQVMNQKAVTKVNTERGLREAISKSQFQLYYQPISSVKDGRMRGFEVLLRWKNSEGVLIAPPDFIPIAEETGLIVSIGEWALNQACLFGKRIENMSPDKSIISVNVSVAQLRRKSFISTIKRALRDSKLSADSLEIEVTESMFIDSFDSAIDTLKQIRNLGVRISLDDFGTGYSSLRHLQQLPISNLKLDHLFIKECTMSEAENAMTSTIIALAHTLKLEVIAEGIEHDFQLQRLAQENCDYFQGYLFGKPMPEENAIVFLNKTAGVYR